MSSVVIALPVVAAVAPAKAADAAAQPGGQVVISEIANGGPGGYHDNFIEVANWGDEPVDVSGWELFRCTGTGSVASAPQNTLQGTIGAGERWLFARESDQSTIADEDVEQRYTTSLANESYGALLRDSSGEDVDAVAIQFPGTTNQACGEGTVLANTTDSAAGESFQRTQDTDDNAADFIRAPRTPGTENATEPSGAPKRGDVLISEVAHTGADGEGLIEVAYFGDQEVDVTDLRVDVVNQFGRRFAGYVWAGRMPVEKLGPGEAVVVPRDEGGRDFTEGAAGVVLYDASGAVWDRVAWADNQDSAAADGTPLPYVSLDAAGGVSYQRTANTGDNASDFVAAKRTPGAIEVGKPAEEQTPEYTHEEPHTTGGANVLVSEMTNTGPDGNGDIFLELQNYGDAPQDMTGWSVYRCIGTGVRASVPQVSAEQLDGVVLEPGQRFTAGRSGQAGTDIRAAQDTTFDISFATQYGLLVFDQDGKIVDRVGSAREDVESFCAMGQPLPGVLNGLHGQSWQRVDITGDDRRDFIVAERTPGRRNAEAPQHQRVDSPVKITEVTNGGPGGAGDNFFELTNTGDAPVDVTGWQVYRCTGTGRVYDGMLQLNLPDGEMAPGEVFTATRTGADSTVEDPDATYGTSFNAVDGFGLMVVDKDRNVVDSVGVFDRVDSPCAAGEPLSDTLDFASGESYQRVAFTGDNAKDYVRAIRTPGKYDPDVEAIEVQKPKMGDVVINEIAAGRPDDKGGQKAQYIEIINNGSTPADLSGLRVDYCAADGRRMLEPAAVVPDGFSLAPGGVLTVARPEAGVKDALATDATFQQEGYGATITDAAGTLLDAVGVYYDDVGKVTNAPEGPCSSAGVPLDRRMRFTSIEEAQKHDYAWHRVQSTGNNWADFDTAPATPGSADGPEYRDVTKPVEGSLDPVEVERATRTGVPSLSDGTPLTATGTSDADVTAFGAKTAAIDWSKSAGFIGASPQAALEQRVGEGETRAADVRKMDQAQDTGRAFPYQRFELAVERPEDSVVSIAWRGHSRDRHELQMYFYNHTVGQWQRVDTAAGEDGGEVTLVGTGAVADFYRDGTVDVLVQDGKRVADPFSDSNGETNQMFKTPGEYDLAIAHVTDSQYLTEQNPASYTQMIAWLAANKDARDIIASVHTGDVIQNWLRGNQEPDRAVLEFERASEIMKIFEDAGMPYGILPGNHDNVWGASNEMFNEYFPASRYESNPWWGGHGPDGNASNFFTMERDGAKFLFLQMGFDSSEEEIDWADKVIADHPDHNVIFSTHEYLRPEEDARSNPDNGRWTAQGDLLFERLVKPHSNVVLVFSGHLHGVRQRITEREDGTHVIETVADYQSYEEDGARDALYTRLYQFDLDSGKVAANAYSPRLQSFEPWKNDPHDLGYTPESDEFVYDADLQYDKQVTTSGIAAFGAPVELGTAQLSDGTAAEFTWDNLEPDAEYLWYTRAQRDASAASGASAADPRYSDFRVFTAPAEDDEEAPETSAPETPAPETSAEQPTATVTATTTTSVSADPVTHTETVKETIKETATETEKVTETEPAVTHRETVTTSTTVVTPTTVTSTAKEVSTAPNTTVTKSVPTTVVTPTTVTAPTTVEVPTTVPTTVEKQGDRVTEEQFPDEVSSVTVGSSVTITPLGILLSLLGALGAVGMIAALLNYMGINLQEYYEQFLDMLP
ncbi:hypothetical protein HMPREF3151_03405 [Corynebacterium sp. HMSC05H05]|nr:hypothetical protein HMPREF3151_03405 [Corynebacterium sp. HMSC05H05]